MGGGASSLKSPSRQSSSFAEEEAEAEDYCLGTENQQSLNPSSQALIQSIAQLESRGTPQYESYTSYCKKNFESVRWNRSQHDLDANIWSRYEVKEKFQSLSNLLCSDVGYAIASTAGIPRHCVMVHKDANGNGAKQWAVRCVHSAMPTPVSYRWGTTGCLTAAMSPPVRCSDCGMAMQGAAAGLDPMSLPEGCFWVDHLCTSISNVFEEMSRAAVLYYAGRLLAHSAERDGERGWLIWEKSVCALPIEVGSYAGHSDDGLMGKVGYQLSNILKTAAAAPMYDKTDLFHICSNLHLVGAIVLSNWFSTHGNSCPPMCEVPGKRLIPRDDPWFGDSGLFSSRIDWEKQWVSKRGVGLSENPDYAPPRGQNRFLLWWPPPGAGSGPVIVVNALGDGYFRVLEVVRKENGMFSAIVPAQGVRFLG